MAEAAVFFLPKNKKRRKTYKNNSSKIQNRKYKNTDWRNKQNRRKNDKDRGAFDEALRERKNRILKSGKNELYAKKFLFIHKGEHLPYIFPIIVLFKFVKVNIKVLGGERGTKNEVLKIGRLERLKVRLYV